MGVDARGHKDVLGIREGATENAAIATVLLEDIVALDAILSPFATAT